MELTYRKEGDYIIPNLMLKPKPPMILGKYAYLRRKYLHDHRRVLYLNLLTSDKLDEHLWDIEQIAMERMDTITSQIALSAGVNEALKASDPMKWIGLMNSIRSTSEETILMELIYC
jgi:hypothetical protein